MALLNHEKREVVFKVVYCGSESCGKTANLAHFESQIDPSCRGRLALATTSTDRTVFIDLSPPDTIVREGYQTRFQIYTLSGHVSYDATRQLIMRGADGLVFVADSRPEAMEGNWRAFRVMLETLAEDGISLYEVPLVLQFNKRDAIDAVSVEYLKSIFHLPGHRLPSFEAVASRGYNVLATLNAVSQLVICRFEEAIGERGVRESPGRGGSPAVTSIADAGGNRAAGEPAAGPSESREALAGVAG